MVITLSPDQIARLRAMIEPINQAHLEAECEPPGYTLTISFAGPYGVSLEAQCGRQTIDLGDVDVYPMQSAWTVLNAPRQ